MVKIHKGTQVGGMKRKSSKGRPARLLAGGQQVSAALDSSLPFNLPQCPKCQVSVGLEQAPGDLLYFLATCHTGLPLLAPHWLPLGLPQLLKCHISAGGNGLRGDPGQTPPRCILLLALALLELLTSPALYLFFRQHLASGEFHSIYPPILSSSGFFPTFNVGYLFS